MSFQEIDALPLVAILRGLAPDEAVEVGLALVAAGLLCLEVPLNSPEPLVSIRRLRDALDGRAGVGAGTVLTVEAVRSVADVGGQAIISPNSDRDVIRACKDAGLYSLPGFFTPTEAFAALAAGADALKLFPAEVAGVAGLRAIRAILPPATKVFPVGGVSPQQLEDWRRAGASGFGLGSALYVAGRSASDVGERARSFVDAWRATVSPAASDRPL